MNKVITYLSLVLSVLALFFSVYSSREKKTGYVLLNDVYEKFELSKELNGKFEALQNKRNTLLDSIRYNVSVAERQKLKELDYYKQMYDYKASEFEKSNLQVREQFDEQVWKQVNQYMLEYGKEKGYAYIYGATGNGSLMYGAATENITDEVIAFVNAKYKGKK